MIRPSGGITIASSVTTWLARVVRSRTVATATSLAGELDGLRHGQSSSRRGLGRITVEMKIAIIGTGIAGLGAAHALGASTRWSCSRLNERVGGHAHTVTHDSLELDTGFIVHNEVNYPQPDAPLPRARRATQSSEMSFAVACGCGLEWSSRAALARRAATRCARSSASCRTAGDGRHRRQVVRPLPRRRGLLGLLPMALPGADDLRALVDRAAEPALDFPAAYGIELLPQPLDARACAATAGAPSPVAAGRTFGRCSTGSAPRCSSAAACARSRRTEAGVEIRAADGASRAFDGVVVGDERATRPCPPRRSPRPRSARSSRPSRPPPNETVLHTDAAPPPASTVESLLVELPIARLRRATPASRLSPTRSTGCRSSMPTSSTASRSTAPRRSIPPGCDPRVRVRAPADDVREARGAVRAARAGRRAPHRLRRRLAGLRLPRGRPRLRPARCRRPRRRASDESGALCRHRHARAPRRRRQRLPLPGLHGARRPRRASVPRPSPAALRLEPPGGHELPRPRPHRHPRAARAAWGRPLVSARSIQVLTNLRVLGYVFNPISFWWCWRADGVARVRSSPRSTTRSASGIAVRAPPRRPDADDGARAVFEHRQAASRLALHADGSVLHLVVLRPGSGSSASAWTSTRTACRDFHATLTARMHADAGLPSAALLRYPLMPARVISLIHWQALRLLLKRTRVLPQAAVRARRAR